MKQNENNSKLAPPKSPEVGLMRKSMVLKSPFGGFRGRLLVVALAAVLQAQVATPLKWSCVGNSITAGSSGPSYVVGLDTLFAPQYVFENDGVGGTTLLKKGNSPYWTNGKLSSVFALKPDIITIKLGTNDSKPTNWAYKADFVKDLTALVDTLSGISSHPKILLCLPCPAFTNTMSISGTVIHDEIIPLIKQVATAKSLDIIDLNTPLVNHPELFSDGVHPTQAGADSLAAIIYRTYIAKTIRIACIGNSITHYAYKNAAADAVPINAYTSKLNMLLGTDYYTENEGETGTYMQKSINGSTSWSYWKRGHLSRVFALKPNIITIKLGTNDSRATEWNTAAYKTDYRAMIDTLWRITPKPTLYMVLPLPAYQVNGVWPYNGINNNIIRDSVIPAIKSVAAEKGVAIIDPNTPFQALKALQPDGVHPNMSGQDTLAHIFYRALKGVVSINEVPINHTTTPKVKPEYSKKSMLENGLMQNTTNSQLSTLNGKKVIPASSKKLPSGMYIQNH